MATVTWFESTRWSAIHRAKGGDEAALREFVDRYRPPVVRYLVRKGARSEAEDLAQEVFVQLLAGGVLASADPAVGRFRNLVLAVTRNVLGHHLERIRSRKRGGGRVGTLGERDAPGEATTDEDFDTEWLAHLLERAMGRLAASHPGYHRVLELSLREEKSHEEIARSLGLTKGTVRNRLHRGRRQLARHLQEAVRDYSSSDEEYAEEIRLLSRYMPDG